MSYKTFNKNQFHYENGNMVDNQTGKTYTQSATNGNDVVILGIPKMPALNDNTFVKKPDIISDIDRAEIAAKLNAARREHRQQVGAAQDDSEQASNYLNEQLNGQPTIYGKIADGIHTVANLGVAVAYASGNPIAIAGASAYGIPSTLMSWYRNGIDSNELLANATPIGKTLKYPLKDYLIKTKDRNIQESAAELFIDKQYKDLGNLKMSDFKEAIRTAKEPISAKFRFQDNEANPLIEGYYSPELGRVVRYDEIKPWVERKRLKYDENYKKQYNAKLAAAEKDIKTYSQSFEDEFTKDLEKLENQGIRLSSMEWLAGNGRLSNTAIKASDYDVARYRSHIPEYIDLAKSLQKSGDLIRKEGKWYGKFGNQLKPVNPRDYIVSRSKAFKKAELYWDGETFRSGMSNSQMDKLRHNGGKDVENWINNNSLSTSKYGNLQPDLVTTPGEVEPLVRGITPTSNNWYGGNPIGNFVQPDKGTTIFEDYWDNFSRQHINKTKVIPRNKQVKSLKGNNGDFNMDDPDIFAYINNNNDKSNFWT